MLRRLAGSALRGAGRAAGRGLTLYVLPDSIIPSKSTQRRFSQAGKLVKSAASWKKKKRKKAAGKPGKPAWPSAPSGRGGLPNYSPSSWERAKVPASLRPSASPPPTPGQRFKRGLNQVARRYRQGVDLVRNPRLVAQMKYDELDYDLRQFRRKAAGKYSTLKSRYGFR